MRALVFTLLAFSFLGKITAQTDTLSELAISSWKEYLPWQRGIYVTQSAQKVWFATEWAVVEIDKIERTPKFITKVEGLSDIGMDIIRYNPATKSLLLVYTNSNLDVYDPANGQVTNLPFIKKKP